MVRIGVRYVKLRYASELFKSAPWCLEFVNGANGYRYHSLVQEILILQKVDHPNIVKLLEIYRTNTHFFIVMEYLDDEEMYYFIKNNFEVVSK